MAEARRLRHPMRAASYEALFGLLAVSGMRIGEALGLEREDVDLDAGLITIRKAKGDRERLVPLHLTSSEALRRYAATRDRLCPTPRSDAFFLSSAGTPVLAVGLRATFREIMTRIGCGPKRCTRGSTTCAITRTAGLCALSGCFRW
jgi:integrase